MSQRHLPTVRTPKNLAAFAKPFHVYIRVGGTRLYEPVLEINEDLDHRVLNRAEGGPGGLSVTASPHHVAIERGSLDL